MLARNSLGRVSRLDELSGRTCMEPQSRPHVGHTLQLDFTPSHAEEPTRWVSIDLVAAALRSEDFASIPAAELVEDAQAYERFLRLARDNPDRSIAPTRAIDRMWHLHMLHPRAYASDCMRLFGDILDHDGGFGATPEEAPVLAQTFASTAELWNGVFGEAYVGGVVKCTRNCQSRCSRRCKTATPATDLGSVIAAVRLAKRRFHDRLIVLPSAEASALASTYRDPERVFRVLAVIALFGGGDRSLREALDTAFGRGAKWKAKDSPQTLARFGGSRHWKCGQGTPKLFSRHVTLGGSVDAARCLQIYYDRAEDGRLEIAWVGEHRPTVSRDG